MPGMPGVPAGSQPGIAAQAFPDAIPGFVQTHPGVYSTQGAQAQQAPQAPLPSGVAQAAVDATAMAQAPGNGARMCQHCNKPAGKGKFCIECGQFIGLAEAQPQVELATQAQVIQPNASAPPFPSFAQPGQVVAAKKPSLFQSASEIADLGANAYQTPAQPAGRQPVTSLNLDPSKLGFPTQAQQAPGSVEF